MVRRLPTMVVPQVANVPAGDIGAAEWVQTKSMTEMSAALRFDVEAFGAVRDDPAAASANVAAFQAADAAARAASTAGPGYVPVGTVVIKGTYYLNDTVEIRSHLDGTSGYLVTNNATVEPLLRIGTADTWTADLMVVTPAIRNAAKTGLGWEDDGTGLEVVNANSCQISVRRITNFATGLRLTAVDEGTVHNIFNVGWMENNRVNLHLDAPASQDDGWIQQNTFNTGRYHHNGGEGTGLADAHHILISPLASANVFINASVERDVPYFHIKNGGSYNQFINCRYESAPPRVHFHTGHSNTILYGYQAQNIQLTNNGAWNHIFTRNGIRVNGSGHGVFTGWGGGASSAVFTVVESASANPETEYSAAIGPRYGRFKLATDAHPRVDINGANGQVFVGDGTVAPSANIGRYGATGISVNGEFVRIGGSGGRVGFYGTDPITKPTVSGSKGGNAALTSLITALKNLGLITDSTT